MSAVTIRPYKPADLPLLVDLFKRAVHKIATRHYTAEQVAVWAPQEIDSKKWRTKLASYIVFVAEIDGSIAGFADLSPKDTSITSLSIQTIKCAASPSIF